MAKPKTIRKPHPEANSCRCQVPLAAHDNPCPELGARRLELMMHLHQHIRAQGWTQKQAAQRLATTQPRVSDLLRYQVQQFALDGLVVWLYRLGFAVSLEVIKPQDTAAER